MVLEQGEIPVRSWRVTEAEPHGLMMWFDPAREIPMLRSTPPISDPGDQLLLEQGGDGTLEEEGVVPCEGSDPLTEAHDDLPF